MNKIPLILDCDNTLGVPGCDVDDGIALLYLLGSQEVDLLGICCSFGNNNQQTVYENTRRMLADWGREDIPVYRGASQPGEWNSPASAFLAKAADEYGENLHLVVTGGCTNLWGAEKQNPSFFQRVGPISMMGGVTGPLMVGNSPMGELNFSVDAVAAYTVFSKAKNLRIATAQHSLKSYFSASEWKECVFEQSPWLKEHLSQELEYWFGVYQKNWGLDGFVNWDVVAAAQLIHPELFDCPPQNIYPTPQSLQKGNLMGEGDAISCLLPTIKEPEDYRRHIYQTLLAAGEHLNRKKSAIQI